MSPAICYNRYFIQPGSKPTNLYISFNSVASPEANIDLLTCKSSAWSSASRSDNQMLVTQSFREDELPSPTTVLLAQIRRCPLCGRAKGWATSAVIVSNDGQLHKSGQSFHDRAASTMSASICVPYLIWTAR